MAKRHKRNLSSRSSKARFRLAFANTLKSLTPVYGRKRAAKIAHAMYPEVRN